MPTTTLTPMRDLIEQRLAGRWADWAREHPALAAAIDRTKLIEQSVELVRDDPGFAAAMRAADLDEARLAAAAQLLDQIDRWIAIALPL